MCTVNVYSHNKTYCIEILHLIKFLFHKKTFYFKCDFNLYASETFERTINIMHSQEPQNNVTY